jgi:hypothetical protein
VENTAARFVSKEIALDLRALSQMPIFQALTASIYWRLREYFKIR